MQESKLKNFYKILLIQPWISYRGAEGVSVAQSYFLEKIGYKAAIATIFVDWQRLPKYGRKVTYLLPPRFFSEACKKSRFLLFTLGPILLTFLVLKNIRKFDFLNPHNLPSVWITALLGNFFGKPVIWTVHSIPKRVSWAKKKNLFEYFVWLFATSRVDILAVNSVDRILAVSKKTAREVKQRYGRDASILYPGIEKEEVDSKNVPKEIANLRRKSELLLLHVGNLHPQKGQEYSLGALKLLRERGVSASIVFIGDGPDEEFLKGRAQDMEIEKFVVFSGFVPSHLLPTYYKVADLNLLPSVGESFARTPFEALMQGKTSIISKGSGVAEVISDYILVADMNALDIYRKARIFLRKRGYFLSRGLEGRNFLIKNFNWEKHCKDFIEIANSQMEKDVDVKIYNKNYYKAHYKLAPRPLLMERKNRFKRAIALANLSPGLKILDMGCGNGEFMVKLAKLGVKVWGVDYSNDAVILAKRLIETQDRVIQKRLRVYPMDVRHLKFSDNFFDRIICLDVFEHIYPKPLEKVLTEVRRVIKPGGLVVVETFPNSLLWSPISFLSKKILKRGAFEHDKYHINIFNFFSLKRTLSKLSDDVEVDVVNDGHKNFSSRLTGLGGVPPVVKFGAKLADFILENPISERVIQKTSLKVFLSHDLWGVVRVEKAL